MSNSRTFEFQRDVRVGMFLPVPEEGKGRRFVIALQDPSHGDPVILNFPAESRLDLGMAILQADGAKVSVKLTWPRPKKEKKSKAKTKPKNRSTKGE